MHTAKCSAYLGICNFKGVGQGFPPPTPQLIFEMESNSKLYIFDRKLYARTHDMQSRHGPVAHDNTVKCVWCEMNLVSIFEDETWPNHWQHWSSVKLHRQIRWEDKISQNKLSQSRLIPKSFLPVQFSICHVFFNITFSSMYCFLLHVTWFGGKREGKKRSGKICDWGGFVEFW